MTRKLTEAALLGYAERQAHTVFLVDAAGIIQYANRRCHDALGFAPSDLIGQAMIELVVQRDRDRTRAEALRVLAGHKRAGFENRYGHRDGSDIHFAWSARWLASHRLRLGVARDVTIHRQPACAFMLPPDLMALFDPYERDVLLLLLTSASESQIAQRLGISPADTQRRALSIYRKLSVRGRLGLTSVCLGAVQALEMPQFAGAHP